MKVLSSSQIREADRFTILHEPIQSIDLMERAAKQCVEWILNNLKFVQEFIVFCGPGNNGGDGLAIARMLFERQMQVTVFVCNLNNKFSEDFLINKKRWEDECKQSVKELSADNYNFNEISPRAVLIDALLGSGLSKPIEGWLRNLIKNMNALPNLRVSIDVPSGLGCDDVEFALLNPEGVVKADYTLTFQTYKLSLLLNDGINFSGKVEVLDIGLSSEYLNNIHTNFFVLTNEVIRPLIKKRPLNGHKGVFGHALLICGSAGKAGAAALSAKACLRSGSGMLTVSTSSECVSSINHYVPEAMTHLYSNSENEIYLPNLDKFDAVGMGCGLGANEFTATLLKQLINKWGKPLVIDADGLNLLAENKTWMSFLPQGSILTPHPGEFDRMFNLKHQNSYSRLSIQQEMSVKYGIYIILKNYRTSISTPKGKVFFNTSGNNGMATAGSGDVLAGLITGLMAQQYSPIEAALVGVYLHGLAGDCALNKQTYQTLIAGDIIDNLSAAYMRIISQMV